MRKLILAFVSTYIAAASPASAIVIAVPAAVASMAVSLLPIIEPIAQTLISAAATEIQKVILEGKCPIGCRGPLALPCKTAKGLSSCKATCQKIHQVGGYEIKIRFGEGWDLLKCVRHRVISGKNTPQGKGNLKSIAVYSQKDLDGLLNLIALQMAAREIINAKGTQLDDKHLKKAKTTREKAIKEAEDLVRHITESISKNVNEGVYGNQ